MPHDSKRLSVIELGAGADDLRLPIKEALAAVARVGLQHVEMPAVGEIAPNELGRSGRRHLMRYLNGLGLGVTALGGAIGKCSVEQQVDHARRTLELAADLGVEVVTVSPADLGLRPGEEMTGELRAAIEQLADRADLVGRTLAIETAAIEPAALRRLIGDLGCDRVRACVDPGELLCSGHDPTKSLHTLADFVGLARARDGLAGQLDRSGREVPLGAGQVDFREYLMLLRDFAYRRPLLIRRRDSERPLAELIASKRHLEDLARTIEAA